MSDEAHDDIVELLDYNKFSLVQVENPYKLTTLTTDKNSKGSGEKGLLNIPNDKVNNARASSGSENELERNMYLDESLDKIEDQKEEEEEDNFDICPDNYEIGFG